MLLVLSLLSMLPGYLHAQQVRARVIDADRRTPLRDVQVLVVDSAGSEYGAARTGGDGFFHIRQLTHGSYTLILEHGGYHPVRRPLVATGTDLLTLPAILMQSEAVALDPVLAGAAARTPSFREEDEVRPEFLLAGARMAELELVNAAPTTIYRELAPGLHIRGEGRTLCVESRRGPNSMRGGGGRACEPVAVIVDGMPVSDGTLILRGLKPGAWESIEYLSAIQASLRYGLYGSSSGGAIVLWTRGLGPHRSAARNGGSHN
jgi:hypothetical protein